MKQRVLITGAGTGLGLATALHLAERNFEVYAGVLTPQQQEETHAQAAERHLQLHTLLLDVTDEECMQSALRPVLANGGLYAVIHSAGISLRGYFEDCDDDEIRRVLDVNLFGAMAVTRTVLPYMRQARRGHLIYISSIGGRIASMARTAYCASKFALEGFAESLMQELLPLGIKVSIVEPAIIRTERWTVHRGLARRAISASSPYLRWFQNEEELADKLVQSSPTKPSDVAEQIYEALTTPEPKLRYVVGKRARLVLRLRRFLPGELFEQLYFGEAMRRITASHPLGASHVSPAVARGARPRVTFPRLRSLIHAVNVLGWRSIVRIGRAKRFSDHTIRGYYTARALITLLNTGFFDEMVCRGSVNLAEFAARRKYNPRTLQSLVDYLYIQRFLDLANGICTLNPDGEVFTQTLRGAFHIVNAYEPVLQDLEAMVRQEKQYNVDIHRNAEAMDKGSGLIGSALAFPFMRAEMVQRGLRHVLDIGCGDATFLTFLCQDNPEISGYGLDVAPEGIAHGLVRIKQARLQDRIRLMVGDLFHLGISTLLPTPEPAGGNTGGRGAIDVVAMVYVLHELQDQIVPALVKLREAFPNALVMICEVIRHSPEILRKKPGGLSEIQFLHELSNQKLYTRDEWQTMFKEAGAVEVEENYLAFARTAVFTVRWQ